MEHAPGLLPAATAAQHFRPAVVPAVCHFSAFVEQFA